MAKQNLTKSTVDNLAPSDEDYVIWDSALPGFGIRVKPSNVKSYIVQYRNRKTGASRRKTIGQHGPLLTFHKAKERARIILADALKGNDPVADDRAIREAPTMRHLALDYLEQHAIPKKRPRSVENDRSMINRIILPRLGSKKVAAVQSRDIHLLHASMKSTPYQANRVLALLSKMLSLASKWGWRSDNPVKGIERFQEKRRERWLSDDELSRLLAVLAAHQNQRAANAVRFQLLTGARLGEVLKARWSDLDFERGVWTKPSHHTKQKRTEHIPLSGPALALLAASVLKSLVASSATQIRRRQSVMPILPTTRCALRRNDLEQSSRLIPLDSGSSIYSGYAGFSKSPRGACRSQGRRSPSGQRRLNKNATQLASSENAFWNSESERALAIVCASWRPHAADLATHYI